MTTEVLDVPAVLAQQVAQPVALATQQQPAVQAQPDALTPVQYAMRAGATPEQLLAALDLQVRADNHKLAMLKEKRAMDLEDKAKAAVLAFRRDFSAFRGENIIITKDKLVDRGKAGSFKQAEYHAAAKLLSPALSSHGFSFRHNEVFGAKRWMTDGAESDVPWVYVTCYLEHRDGHAETLDLEGPPADTTANTPVQNMQVTASYLKRQSLLAITGTATGGEDDENGMRGKSKHRELDADVGSSDDDGQPTPLVDDGRAEARKGMKALTAWWGALTAKQRSELNPDFGRLRRCAGNVDEGGAS